MVNRVCTVTAIFLICITSAFAEQSVILNSLTDTPDPFSPGVAGEVKVNSAWTVTEAGPNVNNQTIEIYSVLRVKLTVLNAANVVVREFTSQVSAAAQSGPSEVQRAVEQSWNGKDSNGIMVADGQYTYTVTGSLIQIQHNKTGSGERTRELVKATASGGGTISIDSVAPTISDVSPTDGIYVRNSRPQITATFADAASGINLSTLEVYLDGTLIQVAASATGFTYTPPADLPDGKHSVVVKVLDNAGNAATVREQSNP